MWIFFTFFCLQLAVVAWCQVSQMPGGRNRNWRDTGQQFPGSRRTWALAYRRVRNNTSMKLWSEKVGNKFHFKLSSLADTWLDHKPVLSFFHQTMMVLSVPKEWVGRRGDWSSRYKEARDDAKVKQQKNVNFYTFYPKKCNFFNSYPKKCKFCQIFPRNVQILIISPQKSAI